MYARMYSYDSNMYLFIHFFIYQDFKYRNKTTSFSFQLHADMVQLTTQVNKHIEMYRVIL